jgi:prepilin-type processing-associated H-X9-DG protein
MVAFYEAAPATDGRRAVLYLDGHVTRVAETDWRASSEPHEFHLNVTPPAPCIAPSTSVRTIEYSITVYFAKEDATYDQTYFNS